MNLANNLYDSDDEALEFLKLLYGEKFTEKPKEKTERVAESNREDKDYSWSFIGMTKGPFSKDIVDHISLRTYQTLGKYISDRGALFITPSQFSSRIKRNEETLEWMNAVVIDVDDTQDVFEAFERTKAYPGKTSPTLINRTSKGLHLWYLFSKPVKATKGNQERFKKIARAMAITANADLKCTSPVQYFRIPRQIELNKPSARIDFKKYYKWALSVLKKEKTKFSGKKMTPEDILETAAVQALLKGVKDGGRNKATHALSILYKNANYNEADTLETLTAWNERNDPPLRTSQIKATVKSVFRKAWNNKIPVNSIRDLTNESFSIGRVITPRKPREQRKRVHEHEWLEDLLTFLQTQPEGAWKGSQTKLAEELKMPLRTLKMILSSIREEPASVLRIEIEGTGRKASTVVKLNDVIQNSDTIQTVIQNSGTIHLLEQKNSEIQSFVLQNPLKNQLRGSFVIQNLNTIQNVVQTVIQNSDTIHTVVHKYYQPKGDASIRGYKNRFIKQSTRKQNIEVIELLEGYKNEILVKVNPLENKERKRGNPVLYMERGMVGGSKHPRRGYLLEGLWSAGPKGDSVHNLASRASRRRNLWAHLGMWNADPKGLSPSNQVVHRSAPAAPIELSTVKKTKKGGLKNG